MIWQKVPARTPTSCSSPGSVSLLTIENPNADTDRELVIFRDSFGSSSGPSAGPRLCQGDAGGHPLPPSSQMGKYLTFTDQDVLFPLQRPGAEQQ